LTPLLIPASAPAIIQPEIIDLTKETATAEPEGMSRFSNRIDIVKKRLRKYQTQTII
jgi:hypothetical protein